MSEYSKLKKEELLKLKEQLSEDFERVKEKGLKLDMSRGKPNKKQLVNLLLKKIGYKCYQKIIE